MKDAVVLVAFDPAWAESYAAARDELLGLLPVPPLLVEHIGSTSVPGLVAKPVIDIIALVAELAPVHAAMPEFERAGYEFRPDVSSPARLFMRRYADNGERTHHLHIHTDRGDAERHLIFRDQLRADPAIRRDYAALKHDLALRHADDREAYARGKDGFVDAVVRAVGGPERRPFWGS